MSALAEQSAQAVLRDERDRARRWAVRLEQENAELRRYFARTMSPYRCPYCDECVVLILGSVCGDMDGQPHRCEQKAS